MIEGVDRAGLGGGPLDPPLTGMGHLDGEADLGLVIAFGRLLAVGGRLLALVLIGVIAGRPAAQREDEHADRQ